MQSRKTLIGANPSEEKKQKYSPELHVTDSISPTFLVQSADDTQANVHSTLAYYQALLEKNVPAQLLIYQKGGHGYSLHNKVQDEHWFPSVKNWLIVNNILNKI
jgi:dipeptidyl aminopeptidase/acylaminoacyl peptidase